MTKTALIGSLHKNSVFSHLFLSPLCLDASGHCTTPMVVYILMLAVHYQIYACKNPYTFMHPFSFPHIIFLCKEMKLSCYAYWEGSMEDHDLLIISVNDTPPAKKMISDHKPWFIFLCGKAHSIKSWEMLSHSMRCSGDVDQQRRRPCCPPFIKTTANVFLPLPLFSRLSLRLWKTNLFS